MRGIHPEVDDQQTGAWGDGPSRLTQQLKVLFRRKRVHDMGQQDRVIPFWQKVFEKITFRDVDLAAQWVSRTSRLRRRCGFRSGQHGRCLTEREARARHSSQEQNEYPCPCRRK